MDDEPTSSSKAALWADIEKLISGNVKVTASYLEELGHELTSYDKDFIDTMVKCSKRYEDVIDSAKVLAILTDGLKTMYMDYSTGLELLDCLSTDVRFDNANYQEAVSVLKERYSDNALNAMGSIFDNTLEFAIEKGTDAMLDHFLKAIG